MLEAKIARLEQEVQENYFQNLQKKASQKCNHNGYKVAGNAIQTRENIFISANIFSSRKFYFRALLGSLKPVRNFEKEGFWGLTGLCESRLHDSWNLSDISEYLGFHTF